MPVYSIDDRHLAPDSWLWLAVAPAVRIVIERGPVPDNRYDRWERLNRKDGTLAVEAMRWLKDAAESGEPVSGSKPFTPEQRALALDAYRMIRTHGAIEQ